MKCQTLSQKLVTRKELARLAQERGLRITERTLRYWAQRGIIPRPIIRKGRAYYPRSLLGLLEALEQLRPRRTLEELKPLAQGLLSGPAFWSSERFYYELKTTSSGLALRIIPKSRRQFMGWQEYFKSRVKRYTFAEQGCPEFWVDLKTPDAEPYGEVLKYLELSFEDNPEAIHEADKMLARAIVSWNITDPQTNQPLPVPTPENTEPLKKLPAEFIAQMHRWLQESARMSRLVPQESETSSGQP